MAITYTDATYISPTSFSVAGNYTHVFKAGRRVICNDDTEIEGTISANSTYGGGITTVVVTDVTLTASLTGVAVSVVMSGATGNLPKHAHTTVEGEGGQITEASISDLDKYTQAETDALLLTVSGVTDHSALDNLDYASSGHTGFQASGDYVTAATLTTASGDIVSQIPTDYISDAEMTTISGDIVNQIPSDYVSDTEMTTISGDIVAQIPSLTGYATEVWVGTNYIDTSEMTTISGNIVSQIPSLSGYATESYVINADSTLSGILAGALDTHKTSDDHDSRYYTEGEVDILIASASGTTDHSALNNLDYASAGHTGFQPAGDYVTTAVLTTASGDIVSQIPTDFISEAEMTTVSGDIVAQIPSLAGYATEGYVDGAITTLSGYVDSQDAATLSSANAYTDTASGTLDEKLEAHKIADDHTIYARVDGSRDFTGQQTFQDNVIIQGDLVVSGTQIIAEVEEVKIEDHTITLNYGETASGISFPTAGVEIDRGTAENYYFVFDEAEDNFKIGISGSLQPVATREDSPIADGVATWEAAEYRFKTTAISDAFNKPFGTITDTVCEGDDSRLSDSRTPTEHGNEAHSPDFASQADLVTVSGLIPTDYISGAEMTTISGDIVAQIPSLAGYATETWVSDNYIDESELTTASGDIVSQIPSLAGYATEAYVTTVSGNIVAQIPTDYVSDSEMTTISGDIVAQIPSLTGYATESWVDTNYIDNSEMTTISGDIVSQIPTDYISDAEMTTISGDLQDGIDGKADLVHTHDDRYYTETEVNTISGAINTKLETHKSSADHDGRYFTETESDNRFAPIAKGVTNGDSHDHSGGDGAQIDHGGLAGLGDDDHTQYVLVNGTRGFTDTVAGIDPEADSDLATKSYVDTLTSSTEHTEFGQVAISNDVNLFSVVFAENFDDTTYALQITIKNVTDTPVGQYSYTITTKAVSGFSVTLSDNSETGNYVCEWFATDATTGGGPGAITHYQDFGSILTTNGSYKGNTMVVQVDDASAAFSNTLYCAADFHYERADADSASTMPAVYLALESGSGLKRVLIEGQICNTTWNWSAGLIYASTDTGGLTQTAPSGTGDQNQIVGWALSADTMFFKTNLDLVER